jgi:FkbM family methyltransferase
MESALRRAALRGIEIQSVFDMGASDGKWSKAAMSVFPEAKFLGIEPLKEREPALKALRKRCSNFDYDLCVAGDSDSLEVSLSVTEDLDGSTVDSGGGITRMVPSKTLDTLVSEHQLKGPFLLKFDTHGYELQILRGSEKVLLETNIIVMEVYNFQITENSLRFHEMCAHLEELGFRSFDMAGPMLREYDNAFWQVDLLFARTEERMFSHNLYR